MLWITRLVALSNLALLLLTAGSGWLPSAAGAAPCATAAPAWLPCAALTLAAGALLRPHVALVAIAGFGQAGVAWWLLRAAEPEARIALVVPIANLIALGCARAAAHRAARRPRPSWRPRVSASP